jgi:hypothetical protein
MIDCDNRFFSGFGKIKLRMKWFERGQASCSELRLNGANFKDKHSPSLFL